METPTGTMVLGEMAHMIADKANGPRGDEAVSAAYLRSYENLILLCADHHKIVDDDPATYTLAELKSIKERHEAWVMSLDNSSTLSMGISYLVVYGDSGLDELAKGRESEVFGEKRYDFHIVQGEQLGWALDLQRLCGPWSTSYESLDWDALRSLGAPVDPLRPDFPLKRELLKQGIDPGLLITSEFGWEILGGNNCAGIDPIDQLASLDPRLGPDKNRWSAALRSWVMASVEVREEDGEMLALLPTIRVREPLFYCLNIEAKGHAGDVLHLFFQERLVLSVVLDGRAVLVPLGCLIEDPEEAKWRLWGKRCGLLDSDGGLSDVEFNMVMTYADEGSLAENFVGPRLLVDKFVIRDASGRITERGDVRRPHRVREYIKCWLFGASCPEIFCRINGEGGWNYLGSALQGAIGPAKARAESVVVAEVHGGDRVEILILEVPGEEAYISVDVLILPKGGGANLLQQCADVKLEASGRISFDFVADSEGQISVCLTGYFERIPLQAVAS